MQQESYFSGHSAAQDTLPPMLPQWALGLKSDNSSVWLCVPTAKLVSACPYLHADMLHYAYSYIELAEPATDMYGYRRIIKQMEDEKIALCVYAKALRLKCNGAAFSQIWDGTYTLSGRFQLIAELGDDPMIIDLPSTLVISRLPASVSMPGAIHFVPGFEVDCMLTMNSNMLWMTNEDNTELADPAMVLFVWLADLNTSSRPSKSLFKKVMSFTKSVEE